MIRIAICDDDITSLELTHHLVAEYLSAQASDNELLIRRFHSPYDLLECLENPNLCFNIYILDIIMPMYTGIELGRIIRRNDEYAVIIYTTGSGDYALDASDTSPLMYLIKPIDTKKLHEAMDAALRRIGQMATRNVLIKRRDGLANVGLHQIEYVEYRDHTLVFYLADGRNIPSRVIQESFSWVVENTLNDPRFLKPHASYAINMDHVAGMNNHEFQMVSGAKIPISKRIYSQVKQSFIEYMVEKNGAIVV